MQQVRLQPWTSGERILATLGNSLERIHWNRPCREEELIFKDHFLQAQELASQCRPMSKKSGKEARDLHG